MTKNDLIKIFLHERYNKPPMRNYPTNKIVYNHIDDIWSLDLADFCYSKTLNSKGFRFLITISDTFSKFVWAILLKNNNSRTIKEEFSNVLTKSKRSPIRLESDRGAEFYNSIFQIFLKVKNNYSRFTDKNHSIAERVIRTIRNLFKKAIFRKKE